MRCGTTGGPKVPATAALNKGWSLLVEQARSLSLRQGRRAGADAIAPVRRGGTPRPGATRGIAGPTGVGSRSVRRLDDTGRAGRVPGHVVAPHPGPGHSCRRKH